MLRAKRSWRLLIVSGSVARRNPVAEGLSHEQRSKWDERRVMPGSADELLRFRAIDSYQTRQEFSGYMGWPLLHPKALPNSSKFCTEPLVRHLPGECGSVSANWRADCSVEF